MNKALLIATALCVAGSALSLNGCARTINQRGYLFDEEVVEEIRPGIDNASSVTAALGTPTIKATFDEETWYYVAQTKRHFAFFRPNTVDHQVLAISFDERGNVSETSRLTLEDTYEISMNDKKTPTRGKELGFFEQIFSNIGRFSSEGPAQPGN